MEWRAVEVEDDLRTMVDSLFHSSVVPYILSHRYSNMYTIQTYDTAPNARLKVTFFIKHAVNR